MNTPEPDRTSATHHLVISTFPDEPIAARIAETLIEEQLAACVNLLPGARSLYRWEGRVQVDTEVLALIKTDGVRTEALIARLNGLHPYDIPEIIAVPIMDGLPEYLRWVTTCTTHRN